jgi:hypothetical protein
VWRFSALQDFLFPLGEFYFGLGDPDNSFGSIKGIKSQDAQLPY